MTISRRTLLTTVAAAPILLYPAGTALLQSATPAAFSAASDRFREMMAIAPAAPLEGFLNFTWVDLERHTAAFPDLDPVDVERSLPAGMIVDAPFRYLRIKPIIGYSYTQIRQQVTVGVDESYIRIARLDVDARQLPQTWENSGFERQESDAGPFWVISENDENPGENILEERFQGTYNAVTVLEDDLIAIAPGPDLLHDIMAAHQAEDSALAHIVEPLSSHLYEDTTSVWHTEGSRLVLTQQVYWDVNVSDALDESDAAVGPMPIIDTITICMTAGGSTEAELFQPQTRESIILKSVEPDQAEQMEKAVRWRFENLSGPYNSGPYAEGYGDFAIEILDHDLIRVTVSGYVPRHFQFTAMVVGRTALLFAYRDPE